MSETPRYFKQEHQYTCSLAALRMVLAHFGTTVTEDELMRLVEPEYGTGFRNLWNSTIARLAVSYGVTTRMYALWPIFKPGVYSQACAEFKKNPKGIDIGKYENTRDGDVIPESLALSYGEMFRAAELGCEFIYGSLTERRIRTAIGRGELIQTSVKLHLLYPGMKHVFHSVLLYGIDGDMVKYHDPAHGEQLTCHIRDLLRSMQDVGAAMVYSG